MLKNVVRHPLWLMSSLVFFVVMITGCDGAGEVDEQKAQDKAAVKAVMHARAIAIKNKDIEAYKKVIMPDYDDGRSTYRIIIEDMEAIFSQNEKVEFLFQRSPVDLKMNSARMVGTVTYKTSSSHTPAIHHERTLFRRVNGQWYISGGIAVGLL